jgi:pSer/pThr/pTyr-binding forkhead associated (FHA) protein
VNDPIISRFAEACGATAPLHLRVDLVDGGRRAEGSVAMPFSLVGRDDACDVTLTDPEVNPRHAWLQVLGGRVLVVDLGSRAGLEWPGQGSGSGWLDVGVAVRIGPFHLRLCSPVTSQPVSFPPRYSPLQSDQKTLQAATTFNLEFRNGKRARDRWTVNRLVTLVGRAPECKIRLNADDIAAYHCGLVLTPSGLWVVDLSGRGVVVNGERMRVSPLRQGAELWVGRFLIGMQRTGPAGEPGRTILSTAPSTDSPRAVQKAKALEEVPDDEVPVGVAPTRDPLGGLPSSHIMADAFQVTGSSPGGGVSNPILVSGSGPPPRIHPVQQVIRSGSGGPPNPPDSSPSLTHSTRVQPPACEAPVSSPPAAIAMILHQLGELHGQMLTQFEQSLGLMVRLFSCLGPEQLPAMQRELARIHDLNSELGQLQSELARRAAAHTGPSSPSQPPPRRPESSPLAPSLSTDSTALHDWVAERIDSLRKERQARWQSLVGMFAVAEGRS